MKSLIIANIIFMLSVLSCSSSDDDSTHQDSKSGSASQTFSILSYNTYLLKTGLKNTLVDERAQVLPDALATEGADVLVLQEVWESEHVDNFVNRLASHGYKYYAYKDSHDSTAKLGNGMLILSRYPIYPQSVSYSPWSTKTSWTEKMANKGILAASVNFNGRFVRIYNTHTSTKRLDAETGEFETEHEDLRLSQFNQIIDSMAADDSEYRILAGDLNMHPFKYDATTKAYIENEYDREYSYLKTHTGLLNVFTDDEMRRTFTFDPKNNSWAADGIIVDDESGQLIDYQLYSESLIKESTEIAMSDSFQIPSKSDVRTAPLSDHYAIKSVFSFKD